MTEHQRVSTPMRGLIAGVAGGAVVVLLLYAIVGSLATQQDNQDTLQLIKDCTIEPAGKCAELQRQQSRAFARMIALANSCADQRGHQSPAQIERCIREGMKDE